MPLQKLVQDNAVKETTKPKPEQDAGEVGKVLVG
jgi:hypothetical protein